MEHVYDYLEFLAKAATVVVAVIAVIGVASSFASAPRIVRRRRASRGS